MTDYRQFVKALVKPGYAILETLDPRKCDLLHMAVGVSGEAGELVEAIDRENVLEELGDSYFYFTGILLSLGISEAEWSRFILPNSYPVFRDLGSPNDSVLVYSARILDEVKKYVIYNKGIDTTNLVCHLICYDRALRYVANYWEFGLTDLINHNKAKLAKRYESLTYSDKSAQERADKTAQTPE